MMGWVIEHRHVLKRLKPKDIRKKATSSCVTSTPAPPAPKRAPTVGASVTILTEEEKRLEKERRKEER